MPILTPQEASKKVLRNLDSDIERDINLHLSEGNYEWLMDSEWLAEKDLIIETLLASGWHCTIRTRKSVDEEVSPWWIELRPTKTQADKKQNTAT